MIKISCTCGSIWFGSNGILWLSQKLKLCPNFHQEMTPQHCNCSKLRIEDTQPKPIKAGHNRTCSAGKLPSPASVDHLSFPLLALTTASCYPAGGSMVWVDPCLLGFSTPQPKRSNYSPQVCTLYQQGVSDQKLYDSMTPVSELSIVWRCWDSHQASGFSSGTSWWVVSLHVYLSSFWSPVHPDTSMTVYKVQKYLLPASA